MLRSDLCDYGDAYILVNGIITVTTNAGANNIKDKKNRKLLLKNNARFVSCITRINGDLIEDADDLDIVIPMYNLLEYSKNYRKAIGSLYNYYRDKLVSFLIVLVTPFNKIPEFSNASIIFIILFISSCSITKLTPEPCIFF